MTKVAHYLQPAQMSNQVMNVIEAAIKYTKSWWEHPMPG